MTTSDKGRGKPRVYALYGPYDEGKERKFRCCVETGLTDDAFKTSVAEMKTYLEATLSAAHKDGKIDSANHSTTVRFALGKAKQRLGIQVIDITLGQLRSGRTAELRQRFNDAIAAARRRVDDQRSEAA